MRRLIFYILLAFAAINAQALTVNCTSGNLATIVSDKNIESLKISGSINAYDLSFIANTLTQLTQLDLGDCLIDGCEAEKPLFANARSFAAGAIPPACFAGSKLKIITLSPETTVIGEGAFLACNGVESITLPQQLDSIAPYAFSACQKLKSITIPASVRVIGDGAFSHNTELATFTVDDANRTADVSIGKEAFIDCKALTEINLGKHVYSIGEKAFSGCSNSAFSINLSDDCALAELGEGAFMHCGLSAFPFEKCPNLKVIPRYAFANSMIKSVTVPSTVKHISEGAFFYGKSLADINLGDCASSISDLLFAGCCNALATGIDDTTNEIGRYAFYGWSQVSKLVLPEAVAYIGDYAFAGMPALSKITSINAEAPTLGQSVFHGITPAEVLLTSKPTATGYRTSNQWKEFKHTLNGDADDNAEININDITSIISNMDGKTPKRFLFEAADANVDNIVDSDDVTTVIETIFNANQTTKQ